MGSTDAGGHPLNARALPVAGGRAGGAVERGYTVGVAQWMTTNLMRDGDAFRGWTLTSMSWNACSTTSSRP
ncbi:MAG: hypothetical protein R2712_16905 [Vicinamibacterales bacterium]